ncbi:MAG TPA: potassium transporter Kup [Deltaproteobacteria bacterium]|nr:potassium transporter Kup [Deltaproteobacteria bacterium]
MLEHKNTLTLALLALGVVFGDIGTSPLYAVKECFHGTHAIAMNHTTILGVLSLIFWSLTVVVSIKYVGFVTRVDNHGEGGIFALLGQAQTHMDKLRPRARSAVVFMTLVGASLLFGEGIITPAISVLSAVEGLSVATHAADPLVLPLTVSILLAIFLVQHRGTARIGRVFGPIMLVWFSVIAVLGLIQISNAPEILKAINPLYAYDFFAVHRLHGIVVLGSVVLCITGSEALYADLGHFGHRAIGLSWVGMAYPALLCNYFGQGALLLRQPEMAYNPFYGLVPKALLYPMVGLATIATIIASQALISGVFSLTQQAIQLGYCPRMRIMHTSSEKEGQIYIAGVNYTLMILCITVVLMFKESSGLAGAYGIAVTLTMTMTSLLYFVVITRTYGWPLWQALPIVGLFLFFDIPNVSGNLLKIVDGGWFTLLVAACVLTLMKTWKDGRKQLSRAMLKKRFPIELFLEDVAAHEVKRVFGTAVFMTVSPDGTPAALLHHVKHNHVLHEKVILLSIRTLDIPSVPACDRLKLDHLGQGFYRILADYGYMEKPNIPEIMDMVSLMVVGIEPATTTYFLGRETLLTTGTSKMAGWRKALFAFMSRNASNPTSYFGIPPNRVVELGAQIEL